VQGSVAVVTGANSGIGWETAAALATLGATTVLACRDRAKAEAAAVSVRDASGSRDVHVADLDLADLASVEACAADLLERFDRLDILVNNAGGIWSERRTTVQGFEQTFGVNHLGPFLLTVRLLDRLRATAGARIVNVSSFAHHAAMGGMRWDDLQAERHYTPFGAYSRSKLANLLFTRELAMRLEGTSVTANAAHPGPVRSGFGMDGDLGGIAGWGNRLVRSFEITAKAGAATSVHLAASPEVQGRSGGYYARSRPARMSAQARSEAAAARLWAASEALVTAAGFGLP